MINPRKNRIMVLSNCKYDFVASLGGNCSVASQLKHRGKRAFSLPLDWTLMCDERPVLWLPDGLRTHFNGFCLRENLIQYEPPIMEKGLRTYHYLDQATGFRFIHHFHDPVEDDAAYRKVKAVMDRRIDRFYKCASEAARSLFILETAFPYDAGRAKDIYHALRETFPGKEREIDLVIMQFRAGRCFEDILEDGHLLFAQYERPINIVYDNQFTAPEWMWMDALRVSGLPLPEERRKRSLLVKWKYKIWATLGKSLEADGAGCANMRFRSFERYE